MGIIEILISINLCLTFIILGLHLRKVHGNSLVHDKATTALFVFMIYHLVYVLVSRIYFPEGGWVEYSSPVSLMYAAFLYLIIKSMVSGHLTRREIIVHSLPYIVFEIIHYTLFLFHIGPSDLIARIYMTVLYTAVPSFFLGYGIWSYMKIRQVRNKMDSRIFILILFNLIVIITIAIFYFLVLTEKPYILGEVSQIDIGGAMLFSFMMLSLLSILVAILFIPSGIERNEFGKQARRYGSEASSDAQSAHTKMLYERSGLSDENMAVLERRIDNYMKRNQPWLDPELKLTTLAIELEIPPHHLTEILNTVKNKSFNEYINENRVELACRLLKKNSEGLSVENVGYQSGFNSKTTFYRWFKQIKKMTPKEYLENYK